jgi:Na+-transporting methylmalonyl-CoA/oxaloacetate decarboxylase gamma subunit
MEDLLSQALVLTAIGMGMTFVAIGTLVLGMYLMTALIKGGRSEAAEVPAEPPSVPEIVAPDYPAGRDARQVAAAAAVAVALAEAAAEEAATPPRAPVTEVAVGGWNAYVRGRHLSRRLHHDLRRTS